MVCKYSENFHFEKSFKISETASDKKLLGSWYSKTMALDLNRLTVSNISATFYTTIKLRMNNVLSLVLENVTYKIQEKTYI